MFIAFVRFNTIFHHHLAKVKQLFDNPIDVTQFDKKSLFWTKPELVVLVKYSFVLINVIENKFDLHFKLIIEIL